MLIVTFERGAPIDGDHAALILKEPNPPVHDLLSAGSVLVHPALPSPILKLLGVQCDKHVNANFALIH